MRCSMDDYIEETYYYDTMKEATEAMDIMRAERACDMACGVSKTDDGRFKLTVMVGDSR